MDATERNQRTAEMKLWEEGRRSVLHHMDANSLHSLYETCGDEQYYCRAQIRCAGRTDHYTYNRIEYLRDCLNRVAETRKQIRAELRRKTEQARTRLAGYAA